MNIDKSVYNVWVRSKVFCLHSIEALSYVISIISTNIKLIGYEEPIPPQIPYKCYQFLNWFLW